MCGEAFGPGLTDAGAASDDERNATGQLEQRPIVKGFRRVHRWSSGFADAASRE
jgi:hypothetical protein